MSTPFLKSAFLVEETVPFLNYTFTCSKSSMATLIDEGCLNLKRLIESEGYSIADECTRQVQAQFNALNPGDVGICICWHCNGSQSTTRIKISRLTQTSMSAPLQCRDCRASIWPNDTVAGIALCQMVCLIFISSRLSLDLFGRMMVRLHPL